MRNGKKAALIFLLCGILIIILLLLGQSCRRNGAGTLSDSRNANGGVELLIDPDAKDSLPYVNDHALEQGVVIAGQESMIFPADKTEAAVDFFNPEENAQMYYLTFELRLYNESGQDYEVLYTSGLVAPGKHIYSITLSRELEKGVYEAVVHVQPYRMNEEKTPTNNADMKIRLIVK